MTISSLKFKSITLAFGLCLSSISKLLNSLLKVILDLSRIWFFERIARKMIYSQEGLPKNREFISSWTRYFAGINKNFQAEMSSRGIEYFLFSKAPRARQIFPKNLFRWNRYVRLAGRYRVPTVRNCPVVVKGETPVPFLDFILVVFPPLRIPRVSYSVYRQEACCDSWFLRMILISNVLPWNIHTVTYFLDVE